MKVLFIASNPADESTLNLEREITELQRRFSEASGEPVSFIFLPGLHAEDFPAAIARHKPDVLHISAHGKERLALSNQANRKVFLDADALAAFLPPAHPPHLVYLNACDSGPIAAALVGAVSMAIGITAPITNRAARAGAVAFYERVLAGTSVKHAFNVAKKMIEILQEEKASAVLHVKGGLEPDSEFLHRVPRLIADFVDRNPSSHRGSYPVRLGLVGCPANTIQVVFFTDDESFIDDDENDLEGDLCQVVRGVPVRSAVWIAREDAWEVEGDLRVFAVGVTGDGTTFSVASTLCEAIEARYRMSSAGDMPANVATAVAALLREDGAELDYVPGHSGGSGLDHSKRDKHKPHKKPPLISSKEGALLPKIEGQVTQPSTTSKAVLVKKDHAEKSQNG